MNNEAFRIELQACDTFKNHWRFYMIEAGRYLFGDLTVRFHYGRMGSRGRTKTHVVEDGKAAAILAETERRCLSGVREIRSFPVDM